MRVAIVEDHRLISAALAGALRAEGNDVEVPALTSLADAQAQLCAFAPQVALVDLDLGHTGSGEALIAPLAAGGTDVIVLSATTDEAVIGRCLERGASGWVPKSASYDDLLTAVVAAAEGRPLLDDPERGRLLQAWRARRSEEHQLLGPFGRLSRREGAVLTMLMEGLSVERIADTSFVSVWTVRSQVRSVLLKLGVNSQLEAVALAHRVGWTAESPDLRR